MTQERRRRNQNNPPEPGKGNLYLLTGLVIGLLLGLVIAWVIAPVKFVDTVPSSLRADFKNEFRSQIASAFNASDNLARAQARLALLGDPHPIQALTIQAQDLLTAGDTTNKAYLLAYLSDALKKITIPLPEISSLTDIPLGTSTSIESWKTITPTLSTVPQSESGNTPTLKPTYSPTPSNSAVFIVKSNQVVCDSPRSSLLLMVEVYNSTGEPIPGTDLIISWLNSEEHFFTGLQPEVGEGYADYLMTPEIVYSIRLASGGISVPNLSAPPCSVESGTTIWGGLKLIFQQP